MSFKGQTCDVENMWEPGEGINLMSQNIKDKSDIN